MSISTHTEGKLLNMLEDLTGYAGVISSDHAYIHDGIAFKGIVDAGTISAAYYIGFKTPTVASGKYIHWRPTQLISTANYIDVTVYEGDAFTAGSTVTPVNCNRMSTIISTMQSFAKGVTVTPAGTIVLDTGVGSTGTPQVTSGGAGNGENEEIVLKQNTSYVIKITPSGSTDVKLTCFWYEESEGLDS